MGDNKENSAPPSSTGSRDTPLLEIPTATGSQSYDDRKTDAWKKATTGIAVDGESHTSVPTSMTSGANTNMTGSSMIGESLSGLPKTMTVQSNASRLNGSTIGMQKTISNPPGPFSNSGPSLIPSPPGSGIRPGSVSVPNGTPPTVYATASKSTTPPGAPADSPIPDYDSADSPLKFVSAEDAPEKSPLCRNDEQITKQYSDGYDKIEVTCENIDELAKDTSKISKLSLYCKEALQYRDSRTATFDAVHRVCGNWLCRRKWKQLTARMLPTFCPTCRKTIESYASAEHEKSGNMHNTDGLEMLYLFWYRVCMDITSKLNYNLPGELLDHDNFFSRGANLPIALVIAEQQYFISKIETNFGFVEADPANVKNWNSMLVRKKYYRGKVTYKKSCLCGILAVEELNEDLNQSYGKVNQMHWFLDFRNCLDEGDELPFLSFPNPVVSEREICPRLCKLIREDGSPNTPVGSSNKTPKKNLPISPTKSPSISPERKGKGKDGKGKDQYYSTDYYSSSKGKDPSSTKGKDPSKGGKYDHYAKGGGKRDGKSWSQGKDQGKSKEGKSSWWKGKAHWKEGGSSFSGMPTPENDWGAWQTKNYSKQKGYNAAGSAVQGYNASESSSKKSTQKGTSPSQSEWSEQLWGYPCYDPNSKGSAQNLMWQGQPANTALLYEQLMQASMDGAQSLQQLQALNAKAAGYYLMSNMVGEAGQMQTENTENIPMFGFNEPPPEHNSRKGSPKFTPKDGNGQNDTAQGKREPFGDLVAWSNAESKATEDTFDHRAEVNASLQYGYQLPVVPVYHYASGAVGATGGKGGKGFVSPSPGPYNASAYGSNALQSPFAQYFGD